MHKLKEILDIAVRTLVRTACRFFFLFPMRQNKIFFCSFAEARDYNCNPKYITEYIKAHFPGQYDLVWQFSDPASHRDIEGIRSVKLHSLRWLYEILTSHVVIMNTPFSFLPRRKGQYVINTWHAGGAYKRVGIGSNGAGLKEHYTVKQTNRYISLYLSSSRIFTESNIAEANRYTGEILNCGMPRNDLFFDKAQYGSVRTEVRTEFGIAPDEMAVLYAPTYRKALHSASGIPFALPEEIVLKSIGQRYGKRARLLFRNHHADQNSYTHSADAVDVCAYPDMQRLLCAADILITDYSSSMWDLALMGKPCLLYVPDLDDYIASDRGFFTEPETWPGILCRDETALKQAILTLDETACAAKAEKYLLDSGSYESGHACEMVAERIKAVMGR